MERPRKIDFALIGIAFTILLECGTAVWWASSTDERLRQVEAKTEAQAGPLRNVVETVARLDERTKGIERIERKLDSMEERP